MLPCTALQIAQWITRLKVTTAMGTWLLHTWRDTGYKQFCHSCAFLTQGRGTKNFSTARLAGESASPNPVLPVLPLPV